VLRNAAGASLAVVVLRCEVGTYLYPMIQSWPTLSRSAETLVVQREGENVLFLNDLRHRANTALSLRDPLTRRERPAVQAVLGKHGMFQGRDYRGIEVLADLRQIPGSPWFMVAKMDTDEIFAEARNRAGLIAIIVGCLILLATSATASVYRHRQAGLFRHLYESERQQREAQGAFRATLYSIGDGVIATDTEGRVRDMNPMAERLTGWTELEARGRPLEEVFRIVNETTRAPVENPMHAVLRDGMAVGLANHTLLIALDGAERPIADSAAPIRDDRSVVSGVVLVFSDQTAQRTAARALRASVERFELADRATFRAIWDTDLRTDRLWWNDNLRALFGYQAEELELEPGVEFWTRHVHAEDLERVNAGLQAALDSDREFWSDAYRFRRKDGAYATVEDRGYIVRDADGHPTRIIGAMQDVTERRRAEAALLEAESKYRGIFENSVVGIFQTSADGHYLAANMALARMFGYDSAAALIAGLTDLDRRFYVEPARRDEFKRVVDEHGEITGFESEVYRKDGSTMWISENGRVVRDHVGAGFYYEGFTEDISARRRLEAQFLQAQKMETVGRLAGGIAHDFNNLLTVINGTADLALADLRAGDPLCTNLQDIQQAGERAAALTRQLLAFSRKQIMKLDVLNMSTLVANLRGMLQRLLGETIDLIVVPAPGVGSVRADAGQIEQVILNLAVNAADAMPDGGTLTIETRNIDLDGVYAASRPSVQPGSYVMLAVSDTGVGMNEVTQQRIFEPFFSTKAPGKGTGLGLSTVYGIVKQSGGTIWVYSEPAMGTTFKVYLPRVGDVVQTDQPAPPRPAVPGSETLLIVEDEKALRHLATRILESAGYTVLTAGDGKEALLVLERHHGPVHLMLTDVVLPGISGRDLAARLVETHPGIKVIFTSGYTDDAILRHGVLDNVAHFIGKPYTKATLTQKVREVLDAQDGSATV
jgi:PAS domain S-box-containing protein